MATCHLPQPRRCSLGCPHVGRDVTRACWRSSLWNLDPCVIPNICRYTSTFPCLLPCLSYKQIIYNNILNTSWMFNFTATQRKKLCLCIIHDRRITLVYYESWMQSNPSKELYNIIHGIQYRPCIIIHYVIHECSHNYQIFVLLSIALCYSKMQSNICITLFMGAV